MSESDSSTSATRACTKCGHEYPATLEYFCREKAGRYGLRSRCKTCDAAYRDGHHEELAAYDAAYRAAHREELAAYKAAYQAAHRDEIATYCAEHRDDRVAYGAAYRAEHPESRAAYGATYRAEHRDEMAAYTRNRKARQRGNGGTHTTADVRAQYARQKGRCAYCREKVGDKYHVDHVMPVILGGSNGPENLVIACPTCNLSKGAKHPQEFAGRLL